MGRDSLGQMRTHPSLSCGMFRNIPSSAAERKGNSLLWDSQLPAGGHPKAAGAVLLCRRRDGGRAALQKPREPSAGRMLGLLWCLSRPLERHGTAWRKRALTQPGEKSKTKNLEQMNHLWQVERGKVQGKAQGTYMCPSYLIPPALKNFRRRGRRTTLCIPLPRTHLESHITSAQYCPRNPLLPIPVPPASR